MTQFNRILWLLVLAVGSALPSSAQTAAREVVVEVGGQVLLAAPGFQRSQVIDADKASFEILPDGVRVSGKQVGRTTVVVWDRDNHTITYQVNVVAAGEVGLARERSLQLALAADPLTQNEPITVTVSGDTATLSGMVSSAAAAERAKALVATRVAKVESRLQVGGSGTTSLPPLPAPSGSGRPLPPLPGLPTVDVRLNDIAEGGTLTLQVGEARLVSVPTELKRALIATDSVADVVLMPPREVVLIGKSAGETSLLVWYLGADAFLGQVEKKQISVKVVGPPATATPGRLPGSVEIDGLLRRLGLGKVEVIARDDAAGASVILLGSVPSLADRQRVEQAIAALFPPNTRVLNLLQVEKPAQLDAAALSGQEQRLEKLLAEELPNAAIRVRLRPGDDETIRVLLSGDAPVPADRLKAEQIVQFELGSAAIITNNIATPAPPPPSELLGGAGGAGSTSPPEPPKPPIEKAIAEALAESGIPTDRVTVAVSETPKKLVTLRGTVRNEDEQGELIALVQDIIDSYGGYELRERGLVVKRAQVVTDVQVVEMTASDSEQLGLVYGVPTGGTSGGSTGGSSGSNQQGTTISATNGQLTVYGERTPGQTMARLDPLAASIRALVGNNRARVLTQPYIVSDDTMEGRCEIVEQVPLPSTTTGTGGATGTSVEYRPVGIRLLVTPRISWGPSDSQIEMEIETEVSAVNYGIAVNINGSVIPGISARTAEATVTVDDGGTLVLGGLTTEQERKNVSRIPFLSSIPVIGELFKYRDSKKEQTTVVWLLSPRIKW
ncbi:MAG: pilus assembly protein N-terminal domain-containing protein [Fimbriimonadaceae bacterium]|nr:pilus assembly protein N-terminal domain-containing protein [Fimbriimonadaceae bacterium]